MVLPVSSFLALPKPALAAEAWPLSALDKRGPSEGRAGTYQEEERAGPKFRGLTLVTVLSIFALVTLGGVVRLTGSGLGCPDWPLCHGKIIPPLDTATLIEYSHRLMASVVGVLVLATAIVVWRFYRRQRWLLIPATLGFLLLVAQMLLGGFTVLRELSAGLVLAHLATAEALMASMVVVCTVALLGPFSSGLWGGVGTIHGRLAILALVAVLAAYTLLLTGSYVAVSGAALSCGQSWPLCHGLLFPEGHDPAMHMLHRMVAVPVGVLIAVVLMLAWRSRHERPALGWTAAVVGGLFLVQVSVGAAVVLIGFPMAARLAHLSMATLVWLGLAALAVLAYTVPKSGSRGLRLA